MALGASHHWRSIHHEHDGHRIREAANDIEHCQPEGRQVEIAAVGGSAAQGDLERTTARDGKAPDDRVDAGVGQQAGKDGEREVSFGQGGPRHEGDRPRIGRPGDGGPDERRLADPGRPGHEQDPRPRGGEERIDRPQLRLAPDDAVRDQLAGSRSAGGVRLRALVPSSVEGVGAARHAPMMAGPELARDHGLGDRQRRPAAAA